MINSFLFLWLSVISFLINYPIHVFGFVFSRRQNIWKTSKLNFSPSTITPKTFYNNALSKEYISNQLTSNDVSYVKILPRSNVTQANPVTVAPSNGVKEGEFPKLSIHQELFSSIFRDSAPYIAMHRGSTMVIHLSSSILKNKKLFDEVMDDISILHLLGVKLVLVIGVRSQLDERIMQSGGCIIRHGGMRVTDDNMMRFLKEESGIARYEIESSLARGFRGIVNKSRINVVSGNMFYTAKPLGVRNGIDFQMTGEVRKIDEENFSKRLESGDIVLLTSLGLSHSGEAFNVPSESLAAECAARLKASKLIYFTDGERMLDTRNDKMIASLRLAQANNLLGKWGIPKTLYNYVEDEEKEETDHSEVTQFAAATSSSSTNPSNCSCNDDLTSIAQYMRLIARCVYSLNGGVKRAHLVPPVNGAILKELYTQEGSGMLISRDTFDGIKPAEESDLDGIIDLIRPLEKEGILVYRSAEALLDDLANYYIMVREGRVVACGMLKQYSDSHAEIGCLAVHPAYRKEGRGEILLAYLEHRAVLMGLSHVFVLSTRTMQWFEERGFISSDPTVLPPAKHYNKERNSKVYIKKLGTQRDVEAEELLWDIL